MLWFQQCCVLAGSTRDSACAMELLINQRSCHRYDFFTVMRAEQAVAYGDFRMLTEGLHYYLTAVVESAAERLRWPLAQ